jgi:hypothetical protein
MKRVTVRIRIAALAVLTAFSCSGGLLIGIAGGTGTFIQRGGTLVIEGSDASKIATGSTTSRGSLSITDTVMTSTPTFYVGETVLSLR